MEGSELSNSAQSSLLGRCLDLSGLCCWEKSLAISKHRFKSALQCCNLFFQSCEIKIMPWLQFGWWGWLSGAIGRSQRCFYCQVLIIASHLPVPIKLLLSHMSHIVRFSEHAIQRDWSEWAKWLQALRNCCLLPVTTYSSVKRLPPIKKILRRKQTGCCCVVLWGHIVFSLHRLIVLVTKWPWFDSCWCVHCWCWYTQLLVPPQ